MISCTEFVPAYSELFKYLDQAHGKEAVVKYWEELSDTWLQNFRDLVAKKGIVGCFEYWSHTLTEEDADFRMELDEDKGVFEIEMRKCPSMEKLIETKHIEPYEHYCEHCDILYRRVLEPLGYEYSIDTSHCKKAKCTITVKQPVHKK